MTVEPARPPSPRQAVSSSPPLLGRPLTLLSRLVTLPALALALACGSLAGAHAQAPAPDAHADAAERYEADSLQRRVARGVAARAEAVLAAGTFDEALAVFRRAFATYATSAELGVVLSLQAEASTLANAQADKQASVYALARMIDSVDRAGLTERESHFVDYLNARYLALGGVINDAEARLLRLLSLPHDATDVYTRTQCHYMAAYCGYYTDQLDRAVEHARAAGEGYAELDDRDGALQAFDGVSTTYFKMGLPDSALHYARLALGYSSGAGTGAEMNLYLNYAEALMVAGEADSAFHYADRAGDIVAELGNDPARLARAKLCLGNISAVAGLDRRAVVAYEQAVVHFDESREPYHLVDALDSLAAGYARLGRHELAYTRAARAFALRDSLRDDRARRNGDRRVAEFERDQLARELEASAGERALAQAVISKRKSERMATAALLAVFAIAIAFVVYRTKLRRRVTAELRRQVEQRTADLRVHAEQLERQTERLRDSNAELERFAYIASHDLKTPLRNVTSFLGLIERRLPAESRALVADYLKIALANARQMHELVTDVLEFSRLNADLGEISAEVSVADTVAAVRQSMRRELDERNAEVVHEGPDATLVLPKGVLDQLLGNLIGNGVKYNESPRPHVRIVVADMGERIRVAVSDNGIGIAPEYHERVFEVFRRLHTSDEYAGTGVGLAACRKVITRVGGTMHLDSAVGRGSTFTIDLPKDVRHVEPDGANRPSVNTI